MVLLTVLLFCKENHFGHVSIALISFLHCIVYDSYHISKTRSTSASILVSLSGSRNFFHLSSHICFTTLLQSLYRVYRSMIIWLKIVPTLFSFCELPFDLIIVLGLSVFYSSCIGHQVSYLSDVEIFVVEK